MSDKTSDADTPDPKIPETEVESEVETPDIAIEDAEVVATDQPTEPSEEAIVDAPNDEPRVDEPAGPSPMPLILGGVLAAAIGAGVMYFVMPQPEIPVADPFDDTRLEALETALIDLQNAPAPVIAAPEIDLSGLDSMTDRLLLLESSITEMNARLEEIALVGASGEGGGTSTAVVAQLTEMRAALEGQRAENEAVQAELAEIAAQADAKVAEAEARAGDAQAAAAERAALAAERAQLAARQASLAKLIAAAETGAPFGDLLAELNASGAALPDGLDAVATSGVPTLVALQNAYGAAARAGLAESVKATMGDSAGERFTAFLRAQVGARSLEARDGDDPDAVLSRAEAALRAGQIDVVLTEIAALPDEGQAAMKSWIDLASARQTALGAISALNSALTEN